MPKGFVETDHVNKDVFMQVLKLKKTSIRRLDEELSIECSARCVVSISSRLLNIWMLIQDC